MVSSGSWGSLKGASWGGQVRGRHAHTSTNNTLVKFPFFDGGPLCALLYMGPRCFDSPISFLSG
eukprot:8457295-Pyramimonas_sp.AAC.1